MMNTELSPWNCFVEKYKPETSIERLWTVTA